MSSDSASRSYETIQVVYEPGSKTGIYYIPFSNLPFSTTWQQIKDWLRLACVVDHVQVFEGSTSGWVRVRGRENFDLAMNHLTNESFNGRALMPNDRNKDQEIMIKEVVDLGASRKSSRPMTGPLSVTAPYGPLPLSHATSPTQWSALNSPQASPYPGACSMMSQSAGYPLSRGLSTYSTTASVCSMPQASSYSPPDSRYYPSYPGGAAPLVQQRQGLQYSHATPQQSAYGSYYRNGEGYDEEAAGSESRSQVMGGTLETERRKIIIKNLSHKITKDQIKALIHKALKQGGLQDAQLKKVELPRGTEPRPRAHIFAHFGGAGAARIVIDQLNGKSWNGRILDVGFTSEGVVVNRDGHHSTHRDDRRDKKSKRDKGKSVPRPPSPSSSGMISSMGGLALEEKRESRGPKPVVVDGSNRKPKSPK